MKRVLSAGAPALRGRWTVGMYCTLRAYVWSGSVPPCSVRGGGGGGGEEEEEEEEEDEDEDEDDCIVAASEYSVPAGRGER